MRSKIADRGGVVQVDVPPLDLEEPEFWFTGAEFLRLLPLDLSLDFEPRQGAPRLPWLDVSTAVTLYDPPRDRMLDYADRLAAILARHDATADDADPETLVGLPIRYLVEPEAVHNWWTIHEHNVLWVLRERLAASGIEVEERAWERLLDESRQELASEERTQRADRYGPTQPFISPTGASKADVVAAYDRLAATGAVAHDRGAGLAEGRPTRDPLPCVQCALWHDEADLSYAEIGRRMGWAIQRQPGQSPKCETARQHAERGRDLIKQGK